VARTWLDNAFWETPKKEILNAISEEQVDNKQIRQVHKLYKLNDDGTPNEMFNEVIEFLGDESIEASTKKRLEKKQAEAELDKQKKLEHERAKKLEKLFEYKLETFEIPEIKASKNRLLKSKLRRSKSIPEVNLYAMMIVKESLEDEHIK
jgi:Rps23 Pro-64 3,4-dihydroxylase Tpa1-like proline 4-hydroxylase